MNKGKLLNFYKNIFSPSFPKIIFFWLEEQLWPYALATDKALIWIFSPFHSKVPYDGEIEIVAKVLRKHDIYHRKDIVPIAGSCIVKSTMSWFHLLYFKTSPQIRKVNSTKSRFTRPEKTAFGFGTLSLKDLAGLKAFARCHRSKMKDLVDIGEILTHGISLQEIIDAAERQFGYDISGKEILESCLNIDDILDNAIDEPIVFLNNKDTSYYIDLLKIEVAKYYHANI